MRIATYNVNSVNARLENLSNWLEKTSPDIVCLQEIKTEFNGFPFMDIQAMGYDYKAFGQKSYNGVAILSRYKMELVSEGIPNFEDENARYLEVLIDVKGKKIRVASIYLPNGNPPYNNPDDTSKFDYKLRWMEALYKHAKYLLSLNEPVILTGDFNVILTDKDVYDVEVVKNNALYREEVKQRLKAIEYLGFYDAYRVLHPKEIGYTYWDYAGNAFPSDLGMRIDYAFLSPILVDDLKECYVDKTARGDVKPSDHTPLVVDLK